MQTGRRPSEQRLREIEWAEQYLVRVRRLLTTARSEEAAAEARRQVESAEWNIKHARRTKEERVAEYRSLKAFLEGQVDGATNKGKEEARKTIAEFDRLIESLLTDTPIDE